jgi:rRNA-processing protein EBP2
MPKGGSTSTSNEAALLLKLKELHSGAAADTTDEAWLESLVVTSTEPFTCDDPSDDLKRELAFYNQALGAVREAQERFERLGVPHVRPDDYFAEMIKSDKHMTKVKRRMIQEQSDLQAAEDRRKQRANKKFGKQVQREVLQERAQKRKRDIAEVTSLRKKRKGSQAEDFDIDVGDAGEAMVAGRRGGSAGGKGGGRGKGGGGGKGGMTKREWKEQRFGKKGKRGDKVCRENVRRTPS